MVQYFKIANADDMSQGGLSKRIHFLKSEEGGINARCEVSEAIYKGVKKQEKIKAN